MSDLLSTGISGLLASQLALNTTSHNITNVNTAGYSRQQVQFGARIPERLGPFWIGAGVDVNGIRRLYDNYLTTQVREANSGQSRLSAFSDLAGRVSNLLGDSRTGLQPALDSFFGAVHDLANNPADTPIRQALLGQGTTLVARFHDLSGQLDQLDTEVNQRISDEVTQINSLGASLAALNKQIQQAAGGTTMPNDLFDKRDALIQQLSSHVGVRVLAQDDNTVNVVIGTGQPLVIGVQPYTINTVQNEYNASRSEIQTSAGALITSQITGGTLGGLLDFRRDLIDPARNTLGRDGIALANAFNTQHRAGMDLHGALGGDFFNQASPAVATGAHNSGTATVSASISNVSQLSTSDYILRYNGTSWALTRTDGTAVPMSGAGTLASPFTADGLSIQVSLGAVAGDSYMIQPTSYGASRLALSVTDPTRIAAASALLSGAASSNVGNGVIGPVTVTNSSNPALLTPATITFTSATTYQINGTGSYTYTAGGPIAANGWSTSITGTPSTGDSFTIGPNYAGSGDNTNALALSRIGDLGVLDGGSSSLNAAYGQFVAQIGITAQQAQTGLDGQTALFNQAQQAQQNVSGVNLDEEATNLVKYQQSYQASAQVISTASTLFQTLIGAIRGG